MSRLSRAWLAAAAGASQAYIIELALGWQPPWWYQAIWPGITIATVLLMLIDQRARALDRQLIEAQAEAIKTQRTAIYKLHLRLFETVVRGPR